MRRSRSFYAAIVELTFAGVLLFSGGTARAQLLSLSQTAQLFKASGTHPAAQASDQQSSTDSKDSGRPLTPGSISGTVLDQSGAVAVGASVHLINNDGSFSQTQVSGENGQFLFPQVAPGQFQLSITAPGFSTQVVSGHLDPGETYLIPAVVLHVAAATAEVRVGVSQVEVAQEQIKQQEQQRILVFIPNFYVSYVPDAAPLNARQKFQLAWKTAVDPVTFAGVGVYAGFEQAGDRYPDYGQGLQGYAKRYAEGYADSAAAIFIGNAILPSVLKQDPRYFYKGTGSTKSRLLYAISSAVICKGDNQRWQPNYSFIMGSIASGAVSNLYVPAADRSGAGLVFANGLIRVGEGSLGAIFEEFIAGRLKSRARHQRSTQP